MKLKFPHYLFITYAIFFALLAIHPFSRKDWIAENLPIVLIVLFLVLTFKKFRFSNCSYAAMSGLIFLHTIGGHYTFERVPFGFITDLFHFSRNNFDRLAHFSVGFYAYPAAEYLSRKKLTSSLTLMALFGIFTVFTIASVYEIIEWLSAANMDPVTANAFLGSQGDIWDAQKDMLADGLGALVAAAVFLALNKRTSDVKDQQTLPC
jgi:putative membrane protein